MVDGNQGVTRLPVVGVGFALCVGPRPNERGTDGQLKKRTPIAWTTRRSRCFSFTNRTGG